MKIVNYFKKFRTSVLSRTSVRFWLIPPPASIRGLYISIYGVGADRTTPYNAVESDTALYMYGKCSTILLLMTVCQVAEQPRPN